MALNIAKLKDGLNKISNTQYPGYSSPSSLPQSHVEWSNIIGDYARLITPLPNNTSLAKTNFVTVMSGVSTTSGNGIIQLQLALTSYATTIALGMQPLFTATPPPIPINLSPVIALGLSGGTSSQCVNLMSQLIDVWFRTGIAINNNSGATIPWS